MEPPNRVCYAEPGTMVGRCRWRAEPMIATMTLLVLATSLALMLLVLTEC
jgi:hypothetical protein